MIDIFFRKEVTIKVFGMFKKECYLRIFTTSNTFGNSCNLEKTKKQKSIFQKNAHSNRLCVCVCTFGESVPHFHLRKPNPRGLCVFQRESVVIDSGGCKVGNENM